MHAAALAALFEISSAPVVTVGYDLPDPAQVERLMQEVLSAGPLDILVNNAGISTRRRCTRCRASAEPETHR